MKSLKYSKNFGGFMKIYILGNGAMASAMAYGMKNKYEIIIVGRNSEKLSSLRKAGFKCEIYGEKYDISGKIVILAFKPYALSQISKILSGKAEILISVMAGITLNDLKILKSDISVICMPNIAAKYGSSTTPYFSDSNDLRIDEILGSFGGCVRLENENDLNAAGVLSGCVPAYLALVAEALANGGVKEGLKKEISQNLVNKVFESSAKLLENFHPALLKEQVCSPGGTTIKGIFELEKFKVRAAFMDAVEASCSKNSTKF